MKANEVKESPKVAQEGHEGGEMQVGQLKASHDAPPAEGPDTAQLRQLQAAANASPQVSQLRALQAGASNSPQVQQTAQLMQAASLFSGPAVQRKKNNTGMPDQLKSGIESLSGMAMDDVKVHYNSDKPAQLNAHAYAQGSDIHVASGQEKHLAHEAWHVVQQRQGRVQPTTQAGDVAVNDDAGLEREADVKGAEALQTKADPSKQLTAGSASSGSTQLVAQLFKEGRGAKNQDNWDLARTEIANIAAADVNEAMVRVERLSAGTLDRYKLEYSDYLSKNKTDDFQWPITYLRGRASRKNGRLSENGSISSVYGTSVQKNTQSYDVHFKPDDQDIVVTTIPDFITDSLIGDVKNVKDLSFTAQLRAIYAMSKGFDAEGIPVEVYKTGSDVEIPIHDPRDFDLIVRSSSHSDGKTNLSGPLRSAADHVWEQITE